MLNIKQSKGNGDGQKTADPKAEKRRRTLLASIILFIPFAGCMYLLYTGGKDATEKDGGRVNVVVPDGKGSGIAASKSKALESVKAQNSQTNPSTSQGADTLSLLSKPDRRARTHPQDDPAASARKAQAEAARTAGGFYAAPRQDAEVERLRREVEELQRNSQLSSTTAHDPVAMTEKQLALAAKYFPQVAAKTEPQHTPATRSTPVERVQSPARSVVSSLAIEKDTVTERNEGFNTAVGDSSQHDAEGIRACVDEEQTLCAGDRVRLRLMEAVTAAGRTIPAGSVLYGTAQITGQRLHITVTGIEVGGSPLDVELLAYDMDGNRGLYIPSSQERTAAKDAAAAVASSVGSGISFTRSAGEQVAMDLTRGVMSGASQYASSKLRQVKVTVRAGYRLMLLSK